MKAGFSKADITPPLGTMMMGVGGRDTESGCTDIHDPIFARAAWFSHDDESALIVSFDLCFLGRDDSDRLKGVIGRELDLSPRQILLTATHSHVSPAVGQWHSAGFRRPDSLYLRALESATLDAARNARATAREATLWTGSGRSRLPMCRRLWKHGVMENAPNPQGFVDDSLSVCLVKDEGGKPLALLFAVAAHPSIVRGFEISAEFPGVACDRLDNYLGSEASLFLQGAGGDSKPSTIAAKNATWNWDANWPEMAETGNVLAHEVINLIETGLTRVEPKIETALIETFWPLQAAPARDELEEIANAPNDDPTRIAWAQRQIECLDKYGNLPNAASVLFQGVQLGKGLRLIAIEGEPVSHYGRMMQEAFAGGTTFSLGYANGEAMYLVTSPMLDEGGMEPQSYWEYGMPAPLAFGMESVVEDALTRLLELGIG